MLTMSAKLSLPNLKDVPDFVTQSHLLTSGRQTLCVRQLSPLVLHIIPVGNVEFKMSRLTFPPFMFALFFAAEYEKWLSHREIIHHSKHEAAI